MDRLKKLALAAALGLSLSANSMYAAPKSSKPSDEGLSIKAFNQVIKGYDHREFVDADGDRIDSADDASGVAHTTVYKMGGKPVAKATYDNEGHIVKLEAIRQYSQKPSAPAPLKNAPAPLKQTTVAPTQAALKAPAPVAQPKPVSQSYSIDWKHLDSVVNDPECQGSVHDLYKFGFGIDTFGQRKKLIRDYFQQKDYVGDASQNEAHYLAFKKVVQERDERALGPLYAAAQSMASKGKAMKPLSVSAAVAKPAYKPAAVHSKKNAASQAPVTPSAPEDVEDSGYSEDTRTPSGDLEQRLYNSPAQTAPAAAPAAQAPAASQREEPRSLGPANYNRDANDSYGRAEQNPNLMSQPAFTAAQRLSAERRQLRNREILAEISARRVSIRSLEQRAGEEIQQEVRDSAPSMSQAAYRSSIPASRYDATRLAVRRVITRAHAHQTKSISKDIWAPIYSSLIRHNEPYRFLSDGTLDFENVQFAQAMIGWITKYQDSGTSRFTAKEWNDYGRACAWLNDAYSGSGRLQSRFAREAGHSWSPSRGDRLDDSAMTKKYFELYCAQQEFWHDHKAQRNKKILGIVLKIGLGYAIGHAIGGHGGHGGGGGGHVPGPNPGHAPGFVSGGTHYVSPGVGNVFR